MGPFCVTRSNPTHQLTDPIQPNPLQVEKCGTNPTHMGQPNPWTHNRLGAGSFWAAGPRLEQPSTRTTASGTYLRLLQTISEISSTWRPKRLVTLLNL